MKTRKPKRGERILRKMVEMKNKKREVGYRCHSVSPYGDGYGDEGYGDKSD